MKFALTEYSMINIFLKTSYIKFGGENSPRSFSTKSKWSITRSTVSRFMQFVFIVFPNTTNRYSN